MEGGDGPNTGRRGSLIAPSSSTRGRRLWCGSCYKRCLYCVLRAAAATCCSFTGLSLEDEDSLGSEPRADEEAGDVPLAAYCAFLRCNRRRCVLERLSRRLPSASSAARELSAGPSGADVSAGDERTTTCMTSAQTRSDDPEKVAEDSVQGPGSELGFSATSTCSSHGDLQSTNVFLVVSKCLGGMACPAARVAPHLKGEAAQPQP
mmetsp:Transcript_71094/g.198375  ORF Transcript_71094/g.198375 Transcript_71094/m.198375 type:complete len:206 (-) Transcript_71094:20-637(-)